MNAYFLDLLKSLNRIAGLRQLENLYAEGKEKGDRELALLLRELTFAASQYPEVPEQIIQDTINDRIRKDQEFTSLNARIIHKWLSPLRNKYFHESHHLESKPVEAPIVFGEKRDQYIHQLLEICDGIGGPKRKPMEIMNSIPVSGDSPDTGTSFKQHKSTYRRTYTDDQILLKEMINAARVEYYRGKPVRPDSFQSFEVDGVTIFCATLEDAQNILAMCHPELVEGRHFDESDLSHNQQSL